MHSRTVRRLLYTFLLLLIPVAFLAGRFDPYQIDGDAVAYMDLADLLHAHAWHSAVNGYWHPLYPALLAIGQVVCQPSRANELGVYYGVNYAIFLLEAAAMWAFMTALFRLRARTLSPGNVLECGEPLLSLDSLRLLGLGLLVVAAQRELSLGKVRPDALLQALLLFGAAALLQVLAVDTFAATSLYAVTMGVCFGLAYLTKSFAFAVTFLAVLLLVAAGVWMQRRSLRWAAAVAVMVMVPFAAIAGPYVAALSHKYGHLDFGDSGGLNYAWYAGDTEKMHLEPWMTAEFGTATVNLVHPERQLLRSPGVYSYKAVPLGTYPDWFDPGYFNQGVKPHVRLGPLVRRDARNAVLIVRYLFNHPEGWLLLLLLIVAGARWRRSGWVPDAFWLPVVALGLAMWALYAIVNVEERYVTLAWLLVLLPLFASLREPQTSASPTDAWPRRTAAAMVVLFSFLATGEMLRLALEARRNEPAGLPAWHSAAIFDAAVALEQAGVRPGDEIACAGVIACLHDHYWARLAGTRITTEVYAPENSHLLEQWEDLPNREQVIATLRGEGARVLVAYFNPLDQARQPAAAAGWRPLGETGYWALPLNLPLPPSPAPATRAWVTHGQGNQ